MKMMLSMVALVAVGWAGMPSAGASHRDPLVCAATDYRDAVREFRREVHRLRYIERYDRRLVDDLERATHRFRSAAHRPDDVRRLLYHWSELQTLHGRVESAIFGRDCYPFDPVLGAHWQRVSMVMNQMVVELRRVSAGRHRSFHAPVSPGFHAAPGRVPGHSIPRHGGVGHPFPIPRGGPVGTIPGRGHGLSGHPFGSSPGPRRDHRRSSGGRDAALAILGGVLSRALQ